MNKILVVRYDTIGDSIFAGAFLRELRHNLPNAQIDVLVDTPAKNLLIDCPYIDNFVDIFHKKYKYFDTFKYLPIFKKYDSVFFLKSARTFSILMKLAGIPNRIGFNVKRNKFLTKKVHYNEDRHEVDCYLDLLHACKLKVENDETELWINHDSEIQINKMLNEHLSSEKQSAPIVLIQAYSRITQKNWIDKYWCKVIEYLAEKLNANVYYLGGEKDIKSYQQLENEMIKYCGKIYGRNLCGKLTVSETVTLVNKSDLVISVDSCTAHMAAALKIPQILIHGSTSLNRWKPKSKKCLIASKYFPCSPCTYQTNAKQKCNSKDIKCMIALQPEDVINKIKDAVSCLE